MTEICGFKKRMVRIGILHKIKNARALTTKPISLELTCTNERTECDVTELREKRESESKDN